MKMALRVDHPNPDFVERQGGLPLYTHLRGGASRAKFRVGAIERSWDSYRRIARSRAPAEVGGAGLIVLQRVFMALEDLGRLLCACSHEEPWPALAKASLTDLDAAFTAAAENPDRALVQLGLVEPAQLEADLSGAPLAAALRLREVFVRQAAPALARSDVLWRTHRALAKATMHGFPIIAGELITELPGAGELAEGLVPPGERPFAVALVSTVAGTEVTTDRHIVRLDQGAVGVVRASGLDAARLGGELCSLKAEAIRNGIGATLPLGLLDRLTAPKRAAIIALVGEETAAER